MMRRPPPTVLDSRPPSAYKWVTGRSLIGFRRGRGLAVATQETYLEGTPLPQPGDLLAKSGKENFPVASRLLPRRVRSHLLAVYGFARLVDDIGDEWAGDPAAALDWLRTPPAPVLGGATRG